VALATGPNDVEEEEEELFVFLHCISMVCFL